MADGVGDRGVRGRAGGGDAEFQRVEQFAVDHDRRRIGAPDPGVPEVASGLEGFDVKTVVMARHGYPRLLRAQIDHAAVKSRVKWFTFAGNFTAGGRYARRVWRHRRRPRPGTTNSPWS